MRHAIRIQPYLPPDLFQRLRAYAAAQSLTVSAVVAAALGEFLERDDGDDSLVLRRLDGVTHAVEQLRRDLDAVGVTLGRFVRYSFFAAPDTVDHRVVQRAEGLYRDFLGRVAEQLRAGVNLTGQVFSAHRSLGAVVINPEKGGREAEGQS